MLNAFIYENDPECRAHIETVVRQHIDANNYEMELALSTGSPKAIWNHLSSSPVKRNLYIFGVNTQQETNGVLLASEIKKHDSWGKFVFVSAHAELLNSVFTHRVEALDFIINISPDDVAEDVRECIDVAYTRLNALTAISA